MSKTIFLYFFLQINKFIIIFSVWNSNLSEALKASQTYNIPLMFYCEEEFTEMLSSLTTIKTRQMLSNPEIGNILNDKVSIILYTFLSITIYK